MTARWIAVACLAGCGHAAVPASGEPRGAWACHQRSASYRVTGHLSGDELGVQLDCTTPDGPRIARWRGASGGNRTGDAHSLTTGEFDKLWSGVDGTGWRNLKNCTAGGAKTDPLYTFDIADDVDHRGFSCRARQLPYPYNDLVDPLDLAAAQGQGQLGGDPP